jgi:hypothetical protein
MGLASLHGVRLTDDISEGINRSADGMIRIHGANALVQAHQTESSMKTMKDMRGERIWQAIAVAIGKKQIPL